jgi:hypothetical protein
MPTSRRLRRCRRTTVFPAQGNGPHAPLDAVGVELDAPIVQEPLETTWQPGDLRLEAVTEVGDERRAVDLPGLKPLLGALAADAGLDPVERCDARRGTPHRVR